MAGSPWAAPVGILIMVGIGVCVGILNGIAVSCLRVPSFMATMATQLIVRGLTLYIVDSKAIGNLPKAFLYIGNGKFGKLTRVVNPVLGGFMCFCNRQYSRNTANAQPLITTAKAAIDNMKKSGGNINAF